MYIRFRDSLVGLGVAHLGSWTVHASSPRRSNHPGSGLSIPSKHLGVLGEICHLKRSVGSAVARLVEVRFN